MNVLFRQQVLEAHADPSTHPDLMIRVTGYSAYFRSLLHEYRQPIVDRILAEGQQVPGTGRRLPSTGRK